LPIILKGLVILIICLVLGVFGLFLRKAVSRRISEENYPPNVAIFVFLPFLFFLTLTPAVFQIRVELRWFQAPLCILILMFVIALTGLTYKHDNRKYLLACLLGMSFLCTNYYYVDRGAKNFYYSTSARIGNAFDRAIRDSTIDLKKANIYIWENKRNSQREDEIKWALVDGYFFAPYQNSGKSMIFVDSLYSLANFNQRNDQIVFLDIQRDEATFKYAVSDITNEYLSDSLFEFRRVALEGAAPAGRFHYDQKELVITNNDFKDFITDGFHENENGLRWTNGTVMIGFKGDFTARDSLSMELDTYMPAACKNVSIRPSIKDMDGKEHQPVFSRREADRFYFDFYFAQPAMIKAINIISDTIRADPDKRRLSFPFLSLKLKD
jgi:hypothetical protein